MCGNLILPLDRHYGYSIVTIAGSFYNAPKESQAKKQIVLEKEDAYKSLETIFGWIGNMDTKASFLLAYLAVLIGFVVSNGKPNLPLPSPVGVWYVVKLICVIALYCTLLISVALFFSTLTARIKSKKDVKSLLFFGTIAGIPMNEYKSKVLYRDKDKQLEDIVEQIHINSEICTKKSKLYNIGIKTTFVETILYVACMALSVF